jgi:mono/diheme cytochrome c family protein
MKRILAVLVVLIAVAAGGFWYLTSPDRQRGGLDPLPPGGPDLANGEIVFHAGGCSSCHAAPNQPDKTRLGGGYALRSPFGTFYVPNISPHPQDGIGSWTPEQFERAVLAGVAPDGRHYYPAFPYSAYQRMTVTDVRDLFGYLKSLPAVEGRAPDHDLPFPFNIRRGVGLWKVAYLDGGSFRPDSTKSETWNRGAYLVESLSHCAECHSPRNAFGGIVADKRFSGGPNPEGGEGRVPNITPAGLKDWTKGDVAEVLSSGLTPTGDSVGSLMTAVVANISKLPDPDRAAIAEYIVSLPPREGTRPAPAQ